MICISAKDPMTPAPRQGQRPSFHDARDLTQGGATAQIVLDEKVYTLRITRAGKLILTK